MKRRASRHELTVLICMMAATAIAALISIGCVTKL